tara:strand:+ start:483 stop:587 length:105 start_codon:yes stop_codon:yes gene_type:complete
MKITEGYLDGALEQIELAHFDLLEYLNKPMAIDE